MSFWLVARRRRLSGLYLFTTAISGATLTSWTIARRLQPPAERRLRAPRARLTAKLLLWCRIRKHHKGRQPKGSEFEFYLASQTISLRTPTPCWLTPSVF